MKKTTLYKSKDLNEIKKHYRRVKTNTSKFNRGFAKVKSTTGYNCNYYKLSNNDLIRNISINTADGYYTLEIIDFETVA